MTPTQVASRLQFRRGEAASSRLSRISNRATSRSSSGRSQGERPFSEVIDAWKESWAGRLSPTTRRRYESILDKYLAPEFGRVAIGRITHEVVQRYINRLAADPELAPGTVRNVYAVFRTAITKGVRMGLVRINPCAAIDLPRPRREEMLFLTADEVRTVAEGIDPWYRVLIYTAAYTGLRAGELGGLQRRDVDLLRGGEHVRRALKDVNGRLEIGRRPLLLSFLATDHRVPPGFQVPERLAEDAD